jgi:hypothetical protein
LKVEAWVISWNEKEAQEYAEHIENFCDVPIAILSERNHETILLNIAILACRADYIWFLKPDIDLIFPDTVFLMAKWMDEHPDVGVLCPNREGEPHYVGGRWPFDKYLADNTAILYRKSVGARFDPEFFFTGWSDLDFGEEVRYRGFRVQVDPRTSVLKHPTPYGSWSSFRRAYNARNRLLLEAKWWWVGRENWQGIDHYNKKAPPEVRIPTMFELAWWSEDRLNAFADSVNHEHPQILLDAGMGAGNEKWRIPYLEG